jgi:hypothetical protein
MTYNKIELEEAKRAIISTINKCEKVFPKLKEGAAQQTLLKRRMEALRIAVGLIEKELALLNAHGGE